MGDGLGGRVEGGVTWRSVAAADGRRVRCVNGCAAILVTQVKVPAWGESLTHWWMPAGPGVV